MERKQIIIFGAIGFGLTIVFMVFLFGMTNNNNNMVKQECDFWGWKMHDLGQEAINDPLGVGMSTLTGDGGFMQELQEVTLGLIQNDCIDNVDTKVKDYRYISQDLRDRLTVMEGILEGMTGQ